MRGRHVVLDVVDVERHAHELYVTLVGDPGSSWTELSADSFETEAAFQEWLGSLGGGEDPLVHVVLERRDGRAVGLTSYLGIAPEAGSIEIGHILLSSRVQRTSPGVETMFLMMTRVFDELGYRRCEWKCDARDRRSCQAAERFGFTFEGHFHRTAAAEGTRHRDMAWYSLLEREWFAVSRAFKAWLDPSDPETDSGPKGHLADLIAAQRRARD